MKLGVKLAREENGGETLMKLRKPCSWGWQLELGMELEVGLELILEQVLVPELGLELELELELSKVLKCWSWR